MAEIRLEGVSKRYGDVVALDNISLTIQDGSFTSVFGPPSSGKSVLLRILLGLEHVDEGRIFIDGQDQTNAAPNARDLSMVFQNLALFPHLSARDNIIFPLRRRGAHEEDISTRLDQISSVLSIAHILHKKPAALSGGERQRVAIGRALIRDAAAYLMDEPIAALDARLRDAMRVELKRLQVELGQTFIYVTHDCDEAMSVADTMAILEHGKIAQVGKPDEVYADPHSLYVAQLVGSPGINVLSAQRNAQGIACPLGQIDAPAGKGNVSLALRPEAVKLQADGAGQLNGQVEDVEHLGGYALITVGQGEHRLRALVEGGTDVTVGKAVALNVELSGLHLFDSASGSRVELGA